MAAAAVLAEALGSVLSSRREILAAYLFGSEARGEANDSSDVDVGVLPARRLALEEVVALQDVLERGLGRRVDLIDLSAAEPFLALDAIRGERVFARDPAAADDFDLYVLRRAGDLAFFERERRRALLGRPA